MTNVGALTILALPRLPNARMAPGEAELRLMVALEAWQPNGRGDRKVGTRRLAELAGMNRRTVLRTRDRLVKAGLIECEPGAGRARSTWRLTFPLDPPSGDIQAVTTTGPSGDSQGVTTTASGDINSAPQAPGPEPRSGDNEGRSGDTQAVTTLLSYDMRGSGSTPAPADRAGARPRLPRNACEFCGSFEHITARCPLRDLAQEERDDRLKAAARSGEPALRREADRGSPVTEAGAALARKLLADRPTKPPEEVTAPRTDEDRQVFARRQVSAARSVRDPAPDEAPLWQEEDPDEPPF